MNKYYISAFIFIGLFALTLKLSPSLIKGILAGALFTGIVIFTLIGIM